MHKECLRMYHLTIACAYIIMRILYRQYDTTMQNMYGMHHSRMGHMFSPHNYVIHVHIYHLKLVKSRELQGFLLELQLWLFYEHGGDSTQ